MKGNGFRRALALTLALMLALPFGALAEAVSDAPEEIAEVVEDVERTDGDFAVEIEESDAEDVEAPSEGSEASEPASEEEPERAEGAGEPGVEGIAGPEADAESEAEEAVPPERLTPPEAGSVEAGAAEADALSLLIERGGGGMLRALLDARGQVREPVYRWQAAEIAAYAEAMERGDAEAVWADIAGADGALLDARAAFGDDYARYIYRCVARVGEMETASEPCGFFEDAGIEDAGDAEAVEALPEISGVDGGELGAMDAPVLEFDAADPSVDACANGHTFPPDSSQCSVCGYVCDHKNTGVGKAYANAQDVVKKYKAKYTPYDAEQHVVTTVVYEGSTCLACGKYLKTKNTKVAATYLESHKGEPGEKCSACKMVIPFPEPATQCEHANIERVWHYGGSAENGYNAADGNEGAKGHYIIYGDENQQIFCIKCLLPHTAMYDEVCADCGETIRENVFWFPYMGGNPPERKLVPHSGLTDDEDSGRIYCMTPGCGYEKICAHENLEVVEHWDEDYSGENYQNTGAVEGHLHVRYGVFIGLRCKDCGYEITYSKYTYFMGVEYPRSDTVTRVEPHDFDEKGVCKICKFKPNVCFEPSKLTLGVGQQCASQLQLNLPLGFDGAPVYKSSNTKVLSVDKSTGVLKGKKAGSAKVTATVKVGKTSYKATLKVTVKKKPTSLQLSQSSLTLGEAGDSFQLSAKFSSKAGANVVWSSSDEGVATVDQSGLVTAVGSASQSAVITARLEGYSEEISANCAVTLASAPIGEDTMCISLPGDRTTLGVGEKKIKASLYLPDGTACNVVRYTGASKAGSVAADGTLTLKKEGSFTITATAYNGAEARATIRVVGAPTSVKIIDLPTKILRNQEIPLVAELQRKVKGSEQECTGSVSWKSSKKSIAEVKQREDGSWYLLAKKKGKVKITATAYNKKKASKTIQVLKDSVTPEPTMTPEPTGTPKPTDTPEPTDSDTPEPTETPEPTATPEPPAEGVRLSGIYYMDVGESKKLQVNWLTPEEYVYKVTPLDGVTDVLSVSEDGVVTALNVGEAYITAVAPNGDSDSRLVGVVNAPTRIEVTNMPKRMIPGDYATVRLTPYDKYGNRTRLQMMNIDSSNYDVAGFFTYNDNVGENGDEVELELYAAQPGTATLTVEGYNGVKLSFDLTVTHGPAEYITLDRTKIELGYDGDTDYGESFQLTARQIPEGYGSDLEWTSEDPSVCTVKDGLVTAVGIGLTSVQVTSKNSKSTQTCTVIVEELYGGGALGIHPLLLDVGESEEIILDFGNSRGGLLTYKSLDPSIVTIDENTGVATGVSEGIAGVEVTMVNSGESTVLSDLITVTRKVDGLDFERRFVKMGLGENLTATLKPNINIGEYVGSYYDEVQRGYWYEISSSDPSVIKVTRPKYNTLDFSMEAVSLGRATITARAKNGMTAKMDIEVLQKATGCPIAELSLTPGQTFDYLPQFYPPGSFANIDWVQMKDIEPRYTYEILEDSSLRISVPEDAATDDEIGVAWGQFDIKPLGYDLGTTFTSDECLFIYIVQPETDASHWKIVSFPSYFEPSDYQKLCVGEQMRLWLRMKEDDTGHTSWTGGRVKWSSDDPSIARIDEDLGDITAIRPGVVTFTATCASNPDIQWSKKLTIVEAPKGIEITNPISLLYTGETHQLQVQVKDYMNEDSYLLYTFSSSDEDIIKVDNEGNLTCGSKYGEATITVQTYNGCSDSIEVVHSKKFNYFRIYSENDDDQESSNYGKDVIPVIAGGSYELRALTTGENPSVWDVYLPVEKWEFTNNPNPSVYKLGKNEEGQDIVYVPEDVDVFGSPDHYTPVPPATLQATVKGGYTETVLVCAYPPEREPWYQIVTEDSSVRIARGETKQLTLKTVKTNNPTPMHISLWRTSNPNVVSIVNPNPDDPLVDDVTITVKGEFVGHSAVSVELWSDRIITIDLEVYDDSFVYPEIPVTSLRITGAPEEMVEYDIWNDIGTDWGKEVTWTTSDKSIVGVVPLDDREVYAAPQEEVTGKTCALKAVGWGEVTITATTSNGISDSVTFFCHGEADKLEFTCLGEDPFGRYENPLVAVNERMRVNVIPVDSKGDPNPVARGISGWRWWSTYAGEVELEDMSENGVTVIGKETGGVDIEVALDYNGNATNEYFTYSMDVLLEPSETDQFADVFSLQVAPEKPEIGITEKTQCGTTYDSGHCGLCTWTSLNPSIATVDATTGIITGVGLGTATISGTTFNGKVTRTCTIKVVQAPTSVELISWSPTLNVGEYDVPSVSLKPAGSRCSCEFSSSDTSVIELKWEDGYSVPFLNAVGKGVSTITVTTSNGLSDSVDVYVV